MTKYVKLIAGFAITMVAISGNAQQTKRIEANVPFAFSAAGTIMPAGHYRLTVNTSNLVSLTGPKAWSAAFFAVPGGQLREPKDFLRFRQSGTGWVLEQVAISGATQVVPIAKRKKLTPVEAACVITGVSSAQAQVSEMQSSSKRREN